MTQAAVAADTGDGDSSLRWLVLMLAAIAVSTSYYESDAIGPIADLLHRQRGFTQLQVGTLNGIINVPSVVLALVHGLLIDRYGPARMALWSAVIGVIGAVLTASAGSYEMMVAGRFLFGASEGAIFIALIAALARWFSRSGIALATALFLSPARRLLRGGYVADVGTSLVRCWLAAAALARCGAYRGGPYCGATSVHLGPEAPAAACRGGHRRKGACEVVQHLEI